MTRPMRLGLFGLNTGHHAASWREMSTRPSPAVPYPVARRMVSLDHLSGRRIGCNLVTGVSENGCRKGFLEAGGSPEGRERAARTADMVYSVQGDLSSAEEFSRACSARISAFGTIRSTIGLPCAMPIPAPRCAAIWASGGCHAGNCTAN